MFRYDVQYFWILCPITMVIPELKLCGTEVAHLTAKGMQQL
jgi:hypothetical protein